MSNSQKKGMVRAYRQGMSLPDIAKLFSSSFQQTVVIVHDYIVCGVRY